MADENILVVGAGASGLMAARELAKAGRRVTILEAKEKTGGRIWDVPAGLEGKSPFMLGAEFIHGDAETTFSLLQEAGITFKQILGKNYNAIDGKLIEFESDRDFWPEMMEKLNDLKDDISLAGFLDRYFGDEKYIAFRESVLRFAEGYDAADANRVSVFSLKKEWEQDEEQHFRIDGGYGRLVNFLEQDCILLGVVILTGKVVSHFNWSRGYVEAITTENERYAGKKAIITLPLGVLQTQDNTLGSVTVSPPLPARMETIREMGFGSVIKVILRFKKPLWPGDAGFIFAKQAFSVWWTQNPDEQPVLTGWLAGPSVKKYQNLHDVDQVELALESLSSMFSRDINELKGNLEEAHSINWGNNPFSRGAYTYISVAEPNAGIILSNPVQDTLYFSGEATFTGAQIGTVEAALVSGKDAAKRVLED